MIKEHGCFRRNVSFRIPEGKPENPAFSNLKGSDKQEGTEELSEDRQRGRNERRTYSIVVHLEKRVDDSIRKIELPFFLAWERAESLPKILQGGSHRDIIGTRLSHLGVKGPEAQMAV